MTTGRASRSVRAELRGGGSLIEWHISSAMGTCLTGKSTRYERLSACVLEEGKALVSLKKGTQLLKYSRKGNPKCYPFRLSGDESSLIWISTCGKEKILKLAFVSKIICGQRTAIFQRFLRPEKDHLSFSLIYNSGKQSLDLISKDKIEAELWFSGLKSLIASGQSGRSKIDGWSEGNICFDDDRELTSNSPTDSSISTSLGVCSPESGLNTSDLSKNLAFENVAPPERSHATNMHVKGASSEVFRVSISSAPSTSSHGSVQDDCDYLGDIYVWGEIICENSRTGVDKKSIPFTGRTDVLVPRPLESNLVFDVQHVACGVKHAALVTRQGEVFTWGEEFGGRLGHGVGTNIVQPRLVESLAISNTEVVACGEFHTCAITASGELYTWGDGAHNAGLLGHGINVSQWVPKRICGPLEGLQVVSVACGTWHTALITSTGQLFTFGDGTFGVLGHGNKGSCVYPREVESLMGLKTVAVACGVWHTAAIVEVIVTQSNASISSGKLFTWGDGDKYRLGHGDKEPRLKPTCIPSLIDYNFYKVACGHSLTVGLTTSGHIFTMGSTVYGQLGNPYSDGKLPCCVEDKLSNASVAEVACGSYHVAVMTTKNDVYTWGKGTNGRLGHGDIEDRKIPTPVESLKDRHVKHITCGSNFSAAICHHKWVSGAEQSQCSSCRQTFGFTRKRHNCYNCGLVHCHSCSSMKALRASLSPNPAKPYRVCDSCYLKLNKVMEPNVINNKKSSVPRLSAESKDKFDQVKLDIKLRKAPVLGNLDMMKQLDIKADRQGRKNETLSFTRDSQVSSFHTSIMKLGYTPTIQSVSNSRAVSPFSRKSSPPRSATPIPTTSGLSFSKNVDDGLKKTNDFLNQELQKLRAQVESLKQHCEFQELELQKSAKKAQDARTFAAEESARSKAAKEVIKSLTAQLKDMAERLPSGVYDNDDVKLAHVPNGVEVQHIVNHLNPNGEIPLGNAASHFSYISSPASAQSTLANGVANLMPPLTNDMAEANETIAPSQSQRAVNSLDKEENRDTVHQYSNGGVITAASKVDTSGARELECAHPGAASGPRSPNSAHQAQVESIEQYEPGVYITLVTLCDGTRDLRRVRFSRSRFGEHQAETWWSINRERVYEKYNVRTSDRASSAAMNQPARTSEEEFLPTPQAR